MSNAVSTSCCARVERVSLGTSDGFELPLLMCLPDLKHIICALAHETDSCSVMWSVVMIGSMIVVRLLYDRRLVEL